MNNYQLQGTQNFNSSSFGQPTRSSFSAFTTQQNFYSTNNTVSSGGDRQQMGIVTSYLMKEEQLSKSNNKNAQNDRRSNSRLSSANNRLAFVKEERNSSVEHNQQHQQQYLTSWQSYREEIRKKIGQASGTILIEDQTETNAQAQNQRAKSTSRYQQQNQQINNSSSVQNLLNNSNQKQPMREFLSNNQNLKMRPSSSIDRNENKEQNTLYMQQNNKILKSNQVRINTYGYNQENYINEAKFKDMSQNNISNSFNAQKNDKSTANNHIDNLFKKYLGSPKLNKDSQKQETLSPSKRDLNTQKSSLAKNLFDNKADINNQYSSRNTFKQSRESVNIMSSHRGDEQNKLQTKEIVHSPSAKVLFTTDIFKNTNEKQGLDVSRDISSLNPLQLKQKLNQSLERTPQQQNLLSSINSNPLSSTSSSQPQSTHSHRLVNQDQINNQQLQNKVSNLLGNSNKDKQSNPSQNRPLSSLEEKLNNLKNSISQDNTPIKFRNMQNQLNSNNQFKSVISNQINFQNKNVDISTYSGSGTLVGLHEELENYKQGRERNYQVYNDNNQQSPQRLEALNYKQHAFTTETSPLKSKQININYPSQQDIKNLDQSLQALLCNKDQFQQQLPSLSYLRDLQSLQNTLNTLLYHTQPSQTTKSFTNTESFAQNSQVRKSFIQANQENQQVSSRVNHMQQNLNNSNQRSQAKLNIMMKNITNSNNASLTLQSQRDRESFNLKARKIL